MDREHKLFHDAMEKFNTLFNEIKNRAEREGISPMYFTNLMLTLLIDGISTIASRNENSDEILIHINRNIKKYTYKYKQQELEEIKKES